MASTERCSCLLTFLLLIFFLLASTARGAKFIADAKGTGAGAADSSGVTVTMREGVAGGHAHGGYSSHDTHNPNGMPDNGVDPRNIAGRGTHRRGAASRACRLYPRLGAWMVVGAMSFNFWCFLA
ncbi:uncharacterized protein LOC100827846 [Brachypodium distachyon]|uniref:Uncharacterized protein n=1 Tax=Brachypodium distachyon TaxID=15368 RepID=I1H2D2_BRADI|nr:uncharacterized protein LOC100827846 [Brachypodium distachyon]KQK20225.1 hypothetical protein BRADI_1g53200v3 [Brachypodium distachyon]PNT76772.1 hypothetical protein BRADI_1g53200v3 [Brachypodium distachyon]|eukprot:XP_003561271.1 uncharacterized protein LOC100827846 [Brachypodium distachyon]